MKIIILLALLLSTLLGCNKKINPCNDCPSFTSIKTQYNDTVSLKQNKQEYGNRTI
jgi:hypothetical protein